MVVEHGCVRDSFLFSVSHRRRRRRSLLVCFVGLEAGGKAGRRCARASGDHTRGGAPGVNERGTGDSGVKRVGVNTSHQGSGVGGREGGGGGGRGVGGGGG